MCQHWLRSAMLLTLLSLLCPRLFAGPHEDPEADAGLGAIQVARLSGDPQRAHTLLAQLRADPTAAQDADARAITRSPAPWPIRFKRATVRMSVGDLTGAAADLDAVRAATPDFPGLDLGDGWLALVRADPQTAWTHLERYRRTVPGDVQGAYLGSLALLRLGRTGESARELNAFRVVRPRDPAGIIVQGELALAEGQADLAVRLASPLADSAPSLQVDDLLWRALTVAGRADEALVTLRRLAARAPAQPRYALLLARALERAGDRPGARSVLERLIDAAPDALAARIALARLALADGDASAALAQSRTLALRYPDRPGIAYLLGLALEAAGERAGARTAMLRALTLQPDLEGAALALVRLSSADSDPDSARAALTALLVQHPDNPAALLALAALDLDQGDPRACAARLRTLVAARPADLGLRLSLAGLLADRLGERPAAHALLAEAPQTQAAQPGLLRAQGILELQTGDAGAAVRRFAALTTAAPEDAGARWLLALARIRQGGEVQRGRLDEDLRSALALDARHPLARATLAAAFAGLPSPEAAAVLAVRLAALAPDQPDLAYQQGRLALARGDQAEALARLRVAVAGAPDYPLYRRALIGALDAAGEDALAVATARDWIATHPEDLATRHLLATSLRRAGQTDAARTELGAILERDPRHGAALNDLAMSLLQSAPARALDLAQRAAAALPGQPAVADTLAAALRANGQDPRRSAAARAPGGPVHAVQAGASGAPPDPGKAVAGAQVGAAHPGRSGQRR